MLSWLNMYWLYCPSCWAKAPAEMNRPIVIKNNFFMLFGLSGKFHPPFICFSSYCDHKKISGGWELHSAVVRPVPYHGDIIIIFSFPYQIAPAVINLH